MTALTPRNAFRWLALLVGVSMVVGAAGAGFLHALTWVTRFFHDHPWLIKYQPYMSNGLTLRSAPKGLAMRGARAMACKAAQ